LTKGVRGNLHWRCSNTLDIFMDCSSFVGHNRRDLGILQQENELISARWLSIMIGKGLGI
jgi:hypothetical protein